MLQIASNWEGFSLIPPLCALLFCFAKLYGLYVMDRAIAVVSNRKARVYSHDFTTQNWNSLSPSNGYCEIKVLERGRRQYLIQIIDEENRNNVSR